MNMHCCICAQIEGRRDGDLISSTLRDQDYVRRIPIENRSFAVIPSLGPLAPGHTLLCPKSHFESFSHIASEFEHDPSLKLDYSAIRRRLMAAIHSCYDAPVHVFEHGSAKHHRRILCTVDHAHLHFVPANVDIFAILRRDSQWMAIASDLHTLAEYVGGNEYLYYVSPEGRALVRTHVHGFTSQWMRQLFCNELGVTERWNWRDEMNAQEADACYRTLQASSAA